jgi:hypothetical protein
MNELIVRWKSDSPALFKKIKKTALSIGGSAAAVVLANSSMSLNLNASLITICGYVIATCAAVAGTAQLTKTDNNT